MIPARQPPIGFIGSANGDQPGQLHLAGQAIKLLIGLISNDDLSACYLIVMVYSGP
jgi:hypothetical protein